MHPTLAAYEIPPAPFAKGGVFACDAGASGLHSHAGAWERGLRADYDNYVTVSKTY
jgi:hypothetical protein